MGCWWRDCTLCGLLAADPSYFAEPNRWRICIQHRSVNNKPFSFDFIILKSCYHLSNGKVCATSASDPKQIVWLYVVFFWRRSTYGGVVPLYLILLNGAGAGRLSAYIVNEGIACAWWVVIWCRVMCVYYKSYNVYADRFAPRTIVNRISVYIYTEHPLHTEHMWAVYAVLCW